MTHELAEREYPLDNVPGLHFAPGPDDWRSSSRFT